MFPFLDIFPSNSEIWTSKIKLWTELFASEASLIVAIFSLCLHMVFLLCMSALISSFYLDTQSDWIRGPS